VRPGNEDVILVTDLLDADVYPAEDLLWLYSERWGIEISQPKNPSNAILYQLAA
jgi:IS4 transposase